MISASALSTLTRRTSYKLSLGKFQLSPSLSFHASSLAMVAEGDKIPLDGVFQLLADGKPSELPASELFAGKKVAICGLPGAFTPTCSNTHLPGFIEVAEDIKAKGVDTVCCISVNDPFVMGAWGKQLGADDKVTMLADGGAAFAKATGLDFDTGSFGGTRLKRLSMLVDDGVISKLNVEDGSAFTDISSAETLLGQIE
uniref:Thioredoxin domain-containing protein n=1 Tax=Fibrocapsa japonica TaxID=94617 RepID=A0A7S2UXP0_9STRA|mmetsp:Transcript_18999/g.27391  ORF Transcript_18999/g.27391 Transcript_18999/m.27391 type:complete len:199 (+) Transcript_18999:64-660(+)